MLDLTDHMIIWGGLFAHGDGSTGCHARLDMSRSSLGVVLRGLPARGRSVTFPVGRKRCISRTMMEWLTLKCLTCFNNIFSNNELISNRFAVFVTCTHIPTYLWNRLLIDFYLCVFSNITHLTKTLHQSYNDGMVNPEVVYHPSMAKTTVMHANSLPPFWYG
jgi:hypothetical protein